MKIQNVTDASFKTYRRVHEGYAISDIATELRISEEEVKRILEE